MGLFSKTNEPVVSKEDAETEAQISAFFESGGKSSATSTGDKQKTIVEKVEQGEEPCNLQYYFDEFFMCYTPKSQLNNWYRYGERKNCAERWQDFKWCLGTRAADEETAQSMLRQRKVDLLKRVRSGPNSEDVWDLREEPLKDPWADSKRDESKNAT